MSSKQVLTCLICGQLEPKNAFMAHVALHLNYCQHKCTECEFTSVTVEEMADHESANPEHMGQLYALRNPYLDRLCRFVYNDCDFGEKNGGLERVLKRKLVSAADDESQLQQQQLDGNASTVVTVVKAEECALPSPRVNQVGEQRQRQWRGEYFEGMEGQPSSSDHQQHTFLTQMVTVGPADQQSLVEYGGANFMLEEEKVDSRSLALERFIAQQGEAADLPQHFYIAQMGEEQDQGDFVGQQRDMGEEEEEEEDEEPEESKKAKGKKKSKEVFENVQCRKCGQWVKGRGICLLYHMNTRHLKFPLYRCLACPRDFFYVTDTTAKNHIRSFHNNDLSLLENNYSSYSRLLYDSRVEFFGESKSEKRAHGQNARKKAAAGKQPTRQKAVQKVKSVSLKERPQSGSGTGESSSHVQCSQCGELVASIYSSQLCHINTKHLHLPVYECRICERVFESLSSSAAVMHVKSIHGKTREQAEEEIIDRRAESLQQLNESYRAYFN